MEKILVALDPGKTSIWAAIHGLNLARRIRAKVYVLVVSAPKGSVDVEGRLWQDVKEEIEALVEQARSEGISVDLYVAFGHYDEEVVKFIRDNKVTLLVLGVPLPGTGSFRSKFFDFVEKIRQRVDCKIEIVNEKGVKITGKRSE